jgi:hypothetical protein
VSAPPAGGVVSAMIILLIGKCRETQNGTQNQGRGE